MLENWWLAHKLEFIIAGVIIGLFIIGSIIYGIVTFIKERR